MTGPQHPRADTEQDIEPAFDPAPARIPEPCYLTRGRTRGRLDARVQIWAVAPERTRFEDGDVEWTAPPELVDHMTTFVGELGSAKARELAPSLPETDAECVRVGYEAN